MTDTEPMTPACAQPVLLTLPAEIDMANAGAAAEHLAAAFAAGVVVIADMTRTTFCDSMGVRILVRACRLAGATGTELRLLVTCPAVLRVMKILGLDAVLPLYHSLDDALAGLMGSGDGQHERARRSARPGARCGGSGPGGRPRRGGPDAWSAAAAGGTSGER